LFNRHNFQSVSVHNSNGYGAPEDSLSIINCLVVPVALNQTKQVQAVSPESRKSSFEKYFLVENQLNQAVLLSLSVQIVGLQVLVKL
jgi:hypothetical protein